MVFALPAEVEERLYPVEDDMGEHELQTLILEILRPLLEGLMRSRNVEAHVGSDQYIYWKPLQPQACVAPDIYVLFGVPQSLVIDSWKVWERGVVPRFALEVATSDYQKDYVDNVRDYDQLGVEEYVIFDPFPGRNRVTFQVFRRSDQTDASGRRPLVQVVSTEDDRVRSQVLDAWIVVVGEREAARLRVGVGPDGAELLPTVDERAEMEARRAEAEAKRAEAEAKRAEAEAKRAEAAEARLVALEARFRSLGHDPEA